MNPSRVRQYLANPKEQEKAKGMKWLLGMMSKGTDASEFFADVVKVVVCKQVEVKKMAYMFLTRSHPPCEAVTTFKRINIVDSHPLFMNCI